MSKHKKNVKAKKKEEINQKSDFIEKLDQFFDSKGNLFFWGSMFFTLLFSFLLFSFRVSEAGDDSAYIMRAYDFVKEFKFPTFQGPLYSIFLGFFIWVFGLNITLLKSLSLVSILFHLFFFYKAFKGKISGTLLIFVIIIISFNGYLLHYSSQTFNEAFFMMLQSIFVYYFFRLIIDKDHIKIIDYVIIGFLVFLLGITKTVGFSVIFAVLVYMLIYKKWKGVAITFVGFLGFYFIFSLIKTYVFGLGGAQFEGQLKTLMYINPYDASEGMESFWGFIQRFMNNSKLYLSKHLFNFLGLKANLLTTSSFLTVIVYLFFMLSLVISFNKNKHLFFIGLYLIFICGATFVSLQTRWDQDRLILVFFPLILLFLFSGIYFLSKTKSYKFLQVILPLLFVLIFFTNLNVTTKKVKANDEYLMQSLAGNNFYGMTLDWINYIKMSQWAAKNVPDSLTIACRKPSISFVYAKRKFHGIYRITTEDPDELLQKLKDANVKYIIMASLRKHPNQKTQYTINTIQRYLYYIQLKYPHKIRHIQTIGTDEPAYLFEIIY